MVVETPFFFMEERKVFWEEGPSAFFLDRRGEGGHG